jgi:N-acetylglucosamine kinase-like BadF-type ATPase
MPEYVVGVDGGNSKTDVVVASTTGRLLARRRGPGVRSPLGDPAGWLAGLAGQVTEACRDAGVPAGRPAACAVYCLANVDLPAERRVAGRELAGTGLARQTVVQNDTLAVLRAGASRPWGIAVVAGAGINAVGVHPSGRTAGFLALGDYTGDFGGGQSLGLRGLAAAVRAADGRGPATALRAAVPAHFGLRRPGEVAVAVHGGSVRHGDLHVLAPVVFAAAAAGDRVAAGIVAEFADEVAVMVNALIRRLHLTRAEVEVVLGGGTLQTGEGAVLSRVTAAVTAVAPRAQVLVLDVPPVFGALVEAWDRLGTPPAALRRLRAALSVPAAPAPAPASVPAAPASGQAGPAPAAPAPASAAPAPAASGPAPASVPAAPSPASVPAG